MTRGYFITLEGGEGAGKSTQARRLRDFLQASGRDALLTREPGGTAAAEAIRALLLDPQTRLAPLAETLLHFAARADHVAGVITPALERGAVVICDRFFDSTMAYQGYGMGVPQAAITELIRLTGLTPDLTLILDIPESEIKSRLISRGAPADRYERMDAAMAGRIRQGFREIAAREPARCVLIDGTASEDRVFHAVLEAIQARLPPP